MSLEANRIQQGNDSERLKFRIDHDARVEDRQGSSRAKNLDAVQSISGGGS